jgi:hypothetical protein
MTIMIIIKIRVPLRKALYSMNEIDHSLRAPMGWPIASNRLFTPNKNGAPSELRYL